MTLEPLRCPNCGGLLPAGEPIEKCHFCGAALTTSGGAATALVVDVSAERYKETCTDLERPDLDILKLFQPEVAARFDELWRGVVAGWEEPAAHLAFLDYCLHNPSGGSQLQRAGDRYEALTGNKDERVWRRARAIAQAIDAVVRVEIDVGQARYGWFASATTSALIWGAGLLVITGVVAKVGGVHAALIAAGPLAVVTAAAYFAQRRIRAAAARGRQATLSEATGRLLALAREAGHPAE